GVRVAAGDLEGNGHSAIITGAGPGGGPHVVVWRIGVGAPVAVRSFFAYDPGFLGRVSVAGGHPYSSPAAAIVTGADAGGGPHVRVFAFALSNPASFFAYDPAFHGGVRVGAGP